MLVLVVVVVRKVLLNVRVKASIFRSVGGKSRTEWDLVLSITEFQT